MSVYPYPFKTMFLQLMQIVNKLSNIPLHSVQITMAKDQEDEKTGYKDEVYDLLQTAYLCPSMQPIDIVLPRDDNYERLLSNTYSYA